MGILILVISFLIIKLQTKGVKLLLLVVGIFFALQAGSVNNVFAGGITDCPTGTQASSTGKSTNSNSGSQNGQVAIAGLVDDNPEINYFDSPGPGGDSGYNSTFTVLTNDNAPNGDPFDISTLKLLSDYTLTDEYGEWHLILANNSLPLPPPTTGPSDNWQNDPNVIGWWTLDLACDPIDTLHCDSYSDPGGEIINYCFDVSAGTCWPSGQVYVQFKYPDADPGDYTINYTVNTGSGVPLIPATITVTVPESPPIPSPIETNNIFVSGGNYGSNTCEEWPVSGFSVDLNDYLTSVGYEGLLPGVFDLDDSTPGIDNSVTVYSDGASNGSIIFNVDGSGILTMSSPNGSPGYNDGYIFHYNFRDKDGNESNSSSFTIHFDCA